MPFIVFEGLDASGKSTQMELLIDRLEQRGVSVLRTREPGGTEIGEDLRRVLLRTEGSAPVPRCELLIYEACRAQLVDTLIRPALERGEWVVSDRYFASTVAFQSSGRNLRREDIDWLNHYATQGLNADLTILVDISVSESERRKSEREKASGQSQDRLEQEGTSFHQSIHQSYHQQYESQQERWLKVDGERSESEVFSQIWQEIERRGWLES